MMNLKMMKEVLDAFRHMKLISDYNRFRLYKYKVEDLIKDYEQLNRLREEIQ
jgi:flagellar basal body rod protein FlgF